MTQHEEAPARTFETLYTLLVWGGFALIVVILLWLIWTLFASSPSGTDRSQALDIVRPTQTALAAAFAGDEGPAVVKLPASCAACHTIGGTDAVGKFGPDLTDAGSVAADRIVSAEYQASGGASTTVEEYIRESIVEPSAYCVDEKASYCTPSGLSTMPAAVGAALAPPELNRLVTYLASLQ